MSNKPHSLTESGKEWENDERTVAVRGALPLGGPSLPTNGRLPAELNLDTLEARSTPESDR